MRLVPGDRYDPGMGAFKKIWEWISHAQTLQGIVQMLWPGMVAVLTGILTAIWADIKDFPFPIVAILGIAAAGVILGTWVVIRDALVVPYRRKQRAKAARVFKIVYENEVNSPSIHGTNKLSFFCIQTPGALPGVLPLAKDLFRIGIENTSGATLRNVRVIIHSISKAGVFPEMDLMQSDASPDLPVNIPPKHTTYFDLGYCVRREIDGAEQRTIESAQEMAKLKAVRDNFGIVLTGKPIGREINLLKNDGYIITLGVYGDDIEPLMTTFRIDARDFTRVIWQN